MTDGDDKHALDQALDVLVYLPIGFVLDFPESVPRYVDRGRRQLRSVSRLAGQLLGGQALGQAVPTKSVERLQAHTRSTLRALGVAEPLAERLSTLPGAPRNGRAVPDPSAPPRGTGSTNGRAAARSGFPSDPDAPHTPSGTPAASAPRPDLADRADRAAVSDRYDPAAGGDVEALAIPEYDSLSASQVVPRLDGLDVDELEAVRRYESANRGRKTILSKVAQLQAG